MATSFEKGLQFVLRWEGGYVNNPNDLGGATNKGITQNTYNSYLSSRRLPRETVRFISDKEVNDIYYNNYWKAAQCDLLPEKLAIAHFDWAVNSGTGRAIKTLQQVVHTPDDGIWGKNSQAALEKTLKLVGEVTLASNYNVCREYLYRSWGKGNQACFLQGWLNRLEALAHYVSTC